jgi:cell division control protein 6
MLDARTLSSLMKKDILFKPYNALQLQEILKQRAELAFHKGVLDEDVIPLCAALAAREHGDARKAIELLYLSGKIAVSEGSDRITSEHVKKAVSTLEVNNTIELIKSLPLIQKGVLYAILSYMKTNNTTKISLQDVVCAYDKVRGLLDLPSISYKSISRIVSEFETYGILEGRLISLGRGKGVSKVLSLKIPISVLDKISLKELIVDRSD